MQRRGTPTCPHPEHQKVGQMIVASLEGGLEGLAVVDWTV